ncbi:NAD(P)-binding domain-containing protein [Paraburkholderia sp. 22099]|jgi:cation diffusion facilitator CzcD-associated flavoprotein CzcO|uniref:NAD(P)/FAD-dependent oxidoreductase n=1 Tax=Paraburkholderia TaxID=1822464 RepID=UPI00285F1B0D|nr:NAD(P)/FAD-dependent oxidoreductase [Paraburkholderia terricola]MDR6496473.1 cation diffusion facilitator CzcD-associated flavoprotein CzcO [Paraburkholderia terricola]
MTALNPPPASAPLAALEARLREDLDWLELPAPSWVPARNVDARRVLDVAVIGAGMAGLAASAELRLLGIDNQRLFDQAPEGQEGPWVTYARMQTLRSPKQLSGPALRLPALTFRAWYEAQFGREKWDALYKIPRTQWMEYLRWYRRALDLPVRNDTRVDLLRPRSDGLIELDLVHEPANDSRHAQRETVLARHVVLATGREGLGGAFIPAVARDLPLHLRAHSSDAIDFDALRGKRVGVVGASASAFDNAATALEAGAAQVDLFVRRDALPRINKLTGIGSPGLVHGFANLPEEWKWRFLHYSALTQAPPPRDSVLRVARFPHAKLHLSSPLTRVGHEGDTVVVDTRRGRYALDYLIFATGFHSEIDTRDEFALIAPHVRRWRDRFEPAPELPNDDLGSSPDLDRNFALQERIAGTCPALSRIHSFNHGASLTHGKVAGDIPAISDGAQRLARAITAMLFDADRDAHYAALQAFDTAELAGDEWADADVRTIDTPA